MALLACSIAACGILTPPAYRMELHRSSWTITSVDEHALASPQASITFDNPAVITTGCEAIYLSWDMDTDGAALTFELPGNTPSNCDPAFIEQDRAIRSAFTGIESWSIANDDMINLHGSHLIELVRRPTE